MLRFILLSCLLCSIVSTLEETPDVRKLAQTEFQRVYERVQTMLQRKPSAHSELRLTEGLRGLLHKDVPDSYVTAVPVNVLLLGFEREQLTARALEPWFRQMAHNQRHLIAPVGDFQTTTEEFVSPTTPIEFNVSISVIEVAPSVEQHFAKLLQNSLRAESAACGDDASDSCDINMSVFGDPELSLQQYYVNPDRMSRHFGSLLKYLKLDNSYTMIVMDLLPPIDTNIESYGYRLGFSQDEINGLREIKGSISIQNLHKRPTNRDASETSFLDASSMEESVLVDENDERRPFVSLKHESEQWLQQIGVMRDTEPTKLQTNTCAQSHPESEACMFRADYLSSMSLPEMVQEIDSFGTIAERNYVQNILSQDDNENDSIFADCLVDAWVSNQRFAFLDLNAGPFEWGPTISAYGAKNFESFPRVPTTQEIAKPIINSSFESSADSDFFLAKIYRDKHCEKETDKLCRQLTQKVHEFSTKDSNSWFGSVASTSRASEDDIFKQGKQTLVPTKFDSFLSELSHSVLSIGVRQLFHPPASLFTPPLQAEVSLHLFVISNHRAYTPLSKSTFDWKRLREELKSIRPHGRWSFRVSRLTLNDEPALSAALSRSLVDEVIPHLASDGSYSTSAVRYIDSGRMRDELRALHVDGTSHGTHVESAVHIPLFLFSFGGNEPILVDKFYQAKALHDMIVITQNNVLRQPTRRACNGLTQTVDLRNPMTPTLSAIGTLVGGLVPAHVLYDQVHHRAEQDWRWAVGARPTVALANSHFAKFGLLDLDAVRRNAILHAVFESHNVTLQVLDKSDSMDFLIFKEMVELDGGERSRSVHEDIAQIVAASYVSSLLRELTIERLSAMDFDGALDVARHLASWNFNLTTVSEELLEFHDSWRCDFPNDAYGTASTTLLDEKDSLSFLPWRSHVVSVVAGAQLFLLGLVILALRFSVSKMSQSSRKMKFN